MKHWKWVRNMKRCPWMKWKSNGKESIMLSRNGLWVGLSKPTLQPVRLPAMSDQVATSSRVESPNLARPFEVRFASWPVRPNPIWHPYIHTCIPPSIFFLYTHCTKRKTIMKVVKRKKMMAPVKVFCPLQSYLDLNVCLPNQKTLKILNGMHMREDVINCFVIQLISCYRKTLINNSLNYSKNVEISNLV